MSCAKWYTTLASICFILQSEKDSKEEILKAFRLFDDDETVSCSLFTNTNQSVLFIDTSFKITDSYQLDLCNVYTQKTLVPRPIRDKTKKSICMF